MDKTKSRLAAFFDNDDEESSFPQKEVDDHKKSVYTQGTVRKSKREKEKEAAEAKRKEEEEHAAKAYAEFLDAFQGEGTDRKKGASTFVRAGQDAGGSAYVPSVKPKADMSRAFEDTSMVSLPPSPPPAAPKPKGKRAMDSFLEEIKREQADREARLSRHGTSLNEVSYTAYEGQSGSKDRGDPETSNLFVANLPQHINEQAMGNFFARAGPVGSIKIMWPRSDATQGPGSDMTATRRNKNTGLSGFVSFMKRRDAETALREFDGYDWGGSVLRVGWSKAVPVAARPMYGAFMLTFAKTISRSPSRSRSPARRDREHDRHRSYSRSRSPHRDRDDRRSRDQQPSRRSRSRSYSPSRSRSRSRHHRSYRHSKSRSRSPRRRKSSPAAQVLEDDEVTDAFIRTVASEMRGHDKEYEETLREREKANSKYAFLNKEHRRYRYYRSLLDRKDAPDPEFNDEGYNSVYSTDSAEESERERGRKHVLGKLARKRFEAMLRALSGRRGEMARCMAFSLEHAEASAEVADIIIASLVVDGTPVPRKVARLHLICDILHNSAAPLPMAWRFRQEFQARLGLVFDHLSTIYHSFPGRITAETFKKQITAVVDIWEDWIVFPPEYTAQLRARLEGAATSPDDDEDAGPLEEVREREAEAAPAFANRFKSSAFKPASSAMEPVPTEEEDDDDDGEPMDEDSDVDGKPVDDDVDGEPVGDDVDGEPVGDDVDGAHMDLDGAPMEDVDGAPMEDVDGEPFGDVDGDAIDVDGEPVADVDGEPVRA
ncbi:uncharacterized protein BXZ73DRAFT_47369 [Epithele typhae]|uniref:uncharacterized protein n=1 Tax=Epithele typhae TaxID=378194 RepID=UPI002007AEC2|nr:uncharacterized protein BXZ73DRAFT_47369 [Epithele typhae]KAH9931062.1 hypothetical protein BXZ73DRAFT_47369 [Epithele typhae]